MITALKQLWVMLATFFAAGEKLAKAVDDLASYAQEGTDSFLKEARLERAKAYKDLEDQLKAHNIQ